VALTIASGAPTLLVRRTAYESSGISRAAIDERLGLTPDEFQVQGDLVAIGPLHGAAADSLGELVADLERLGLVYFDDFFELSGGWPEWVRLYASAE